MADNLSDALVMAGAVLIFIIALTVSMSSFSTMRSQIDDIVESDSKLDLLMDDGKYLNYLTSQDDGDVRIVGIETIISSLYRVEKENYRVYIKSSAIPRDLATVYTNANPQTYKKDDGSSELLINTGDKVLEITINNKNSNITNLFSKDGKNLYDKLKGKKFKEYLGVYQERTADEVSAENKTTYRVITYIEI